MKFPVDFLAEVSQAELEQLARNYMSSLLYSNPDSPEHLILSDSTQVTIDISSVGFVPLYGSSDKQKILALFSSGDPFTAVALYLLDQWWPVDEILKTADPARDGTLEVQTVGERIVLYILNRVIYRAKEMSSEERPFLCHEEKDHAKILWNNGEAVGFYSVKPSGSSCNSFSTRSYQLPVMDSIFVRKCQRGKGFGLQMLEDFALSFKEDCLGLRYPLTKSMYKVCETYLCQYPGDTGLLWEVESIGGPNQRTNIASKIQAMDMTKVSKSFSFTEQSVVITDMTEKDVVMETIATQIKEAESLKCTVEIVEDLTVQRDTEVSEAVPVADRSRSNASKQRKMAEKLTEDKSENIIRIEDIEAETPRKEQLNNIYELLQTESMFSVIPEEKGKDVVDTEPKEEATTMSDKQATVLASQDLEDADVTLAPTYEEPQVEDPTQDLNNTYHDSQISFENLASETEAAVNECHQEKITVLVVSEEIVEVNKTFETQMEVTERFEESVTTSQDVEAGKTGIAVVKAIKTVQSETRRQKFQQHKNPEVGIKKEVTAQEGGRVLRGRTIKSNPTLKHKYGQHSQKASEELHKEVDEVAEESEAVEEPAVTKGKEPKEMTSIREDALAVEEFREEKGQQLEGEQLTHEEEAEKREDPRVEDTALCGSSVELHFTTDEKVTDEHVRQHLGVEQEETVDKIEEGISTEDLTVMEEGAIPNAEEAAAESVELHKEITKEKETESVIEEMRQDEEDPGNVDVLNEAAILLAEEPQEKDSGFGIPKLQKSSVSSADLNTTCHLGMKEGQVTLVDEECAVPEKKIELIAAEGCVAEEHRSEPELLVLEQENREKQEKSTEKPVDTTAETETVKQELEEDISDQDKEEFVNVHEEKSEADKALVIETRVLRNRRKSVEASCISTIRSNQQQKEDNTGECITEKGVNEAETGTVEVEAIVHDAITVMVSVDKKQPVVLQTFVDIKSEDGAQENLPTSEVDEAMSMEDNEAPVVEARALRSGTKAVTAIPRHRTPRSRKQACEQETQNCEEQQVMTTRTLRRETVSATPKGNFRRTCRHIQEEELKGELEYKHVKETGLKEEEEEFKEATNKEREKRTEEIREMVEVGEGEAPDEMEVRKGGLVTFEVKNGEPEEGTTAMTEGEENTPATDSTIPRPSAEEQHSEEMVLQLSDLQSMTVVLVDLKNTHHEVLKETAAEGEIMVQEMEERFEDEDVTQQVENIEPIIDIEKVDTVAKEAAIQQYAPGEGHTSSIETVDEDSEAAAGQSAGEHQTLVDIAEEAVTMQDTAEGEQSILTFKVVENVAEESAQHALLTARDDEAKGVSEEEETPVITETRVLRSGEKTLRATGCSKITKIQAGEHQEGATGKKRMQGNEPAVETRVLRKGRRSVVATTRHKSKRARTQCETEEGGEDKITQAEEIQVQKTKAVLGEAEVKRKSKDDEIEENNDEEAAAQEEENIEPEVEMEKIEAVTDESLTEQETAKETKALRKGKMRALATPWCKSKQVHTQCQPEEEEKDVNPERKKEKAVQGPEHRGEKPQEEDVEEKDIMSFAGGESALGDAKQMKDVLTKKAVVLEKEDNGTDTAEISSSEIEDTNPDEEDAITVNLTAETEVGSAIAAIAEEEALVELLEEAPLITTRTLRSKATPSPRFKRQKDQGPVETQQKEEETLKDEEMYQLTDGSPETRELNATEQTKIEETSPTGQKAGAQAEDAAEGHTKLTAHLVEPAGEETGADEAGSPGEEPSESKKSLVLDSRHPRRKIKTIEDKAKIHLPKQRSILKKPRVDYRENDSDDEVGETETATDKEEEGNVESDEGKDKNVANGSDEEVELVNISQVNEGDQNMSEEGTIAKRVLRGRSVPSVIITPLSKSRLCSAKLQRADECFDEEKIPQSAHKRTLRKRKSTEITQTRKSKRLSKV